AAAEAGAGGAAAGAGGRRQPRSGSHGGARSPSAEPRIRRFGRSWTHYRRLGGYHRRALGSALITGGAGFIGSHLSELLLDQGTENVLDHCNRFGKRVLVASTSEVYGDRREPEALSEESKRMYGPTTARRWAYAESKALDEFLALAYHQERGLDCVIVRLFNT